VRFEGYPKLFKNLRASLRGEVYENELLSRHTTWRVGGAVDFFIVPEDKSELLTSLDLLHDAGIPWFVLGAGSNLLVKDGGVRGAVIHLSRFQQMVFDAEGKARAGGGLPLMTLIRQSALRGLSGLESLAGIPGTVGGAVAMNAGAGGREMADVVRSVTLADPGGEEIWEAERLRFGYRSLELGGEKVVVEALLRLEQAEVAMLEEEIRWRIAHRQVAHSVDGFNAGSVFKNPEGCQAWRLIEEAGLRGASVGGARVSEKHANFIVNNGSATSSDILELMNRIRDTVRLRTGIMLEPEVRIVGTD
jgi:UDP-N-acetylmuramate dehydrogenase